MLMYLLFIYKRLYKLNITKPLIYRIFIIIL